MRVLGVVKDEDVGGREGRIQYMTDVSFFDDQLRRGNAMRARVDWVVRKAMDGRH